MTLANPLICVTLSKLSLICVTLGKSSLISVAHGEPSPISIQVSTNSRLVQRFAGNGPNGLSSYNYYYYYYYYYILM